MVLNILITMDTSKLMEFALIGLIIIYGELQAFYLIIATFLNLFNIIIRFKFN